MGQAKILHIFTNTIPPCLLKPTQIGLLDHKMNSSMISASDFVFKT